MNPEEVTPTGFEPVFDDSQLTQAQRVSDSRSTDVRKNARIKPENDPDLATVIDAWPTLPEAVRAGITAMVKASK